MKNNPTLPPAVQEPSEVDIREYAYHLYEQSSCQAGHDLDNWLEATACLKASIPAHCYHNRLHHHFTGARSNSLHEVHSENSDRIE